MDSSTCKVLPGLDVQEQPSTMEGQAPCTAVEQILCPVIETVPLNSSSDDSTAAALNLRSGQSSDGELGHTKDTGANGFVSAEQDKPTGVSPEASPSIDGIQPQAVDQFVMNDCSRTASARLTVPSSGRRLSRCVSEGDVDDRLERPAKDTPELPPCAKLPCNETESTVAVSTDDPTNTPSELQPFPLIERLEDLALPAGESLQTNDKEGAGLEQVLVERSGAGLTVTDGGETAGTGNMPAGTSPITHRLQNEGVDSPLDTALETGDEATPSSPLFREFPSPSQLLLSDPPRSETRTLKLRPMPISNPVRENGEPYTGELYFGIRTNCKVYENETQLTKACHCCQDQHFYMSCNSQQIPRGGSAPCQASFCERCVRRLCPDAKDYTELSAFCLRCRNLCTCTRCRNRFRRFRNRKKSLGPEWTPVTAHRLTGPKASAEGEPVKQYTGLQVQDEGTDGTPAGSIAKTEGDAPDEDDEPIASLQLHHDSGRPRRKRQKPVRLGEADANVATTESAMDSKHQQWLNDEARLAALAVVCAELPPSPPAFKRLRNVKVLAASVGTDKSKADVQEPSTDIDFENGANTLSDRTGGGEEGRRSRNVHKPSASTATEPVGKLGGKAPGASKGSRSDLSAALGEDAEAGVADDVDQDIDDDGYQAPRNGRKTGSVNALTTAPARTSARRSSMGQVPATSRAARNGDGPTLPGVSKPARAHAAVSGHGRGEGGGAGEPSAAGAGSDAPDPAAHGDVPKSVFDFMLVHAMEELERPDQPPAMPTTAAVGALQQVPAPGSMEAVIAAAGQAHATEMVERATARRGPPKPAAKEGALPSLPLELAQPIKRQAASQAMARITAAREAEERELGRGARKEGAEPREEGAVSAKLAPGSSSSPDSKLAKASSSGAAVRSPAPVSSAVCGAAGVQCIQGDAAGDAAGTSKGARSSPVTKAEHMGWDDFFRITPDELREMGAIGIERVASLMNSHLGWALLVPSSDEAPSSTHAKIRSTQLQKTSVLQRKPLAAPPSAALTAPSPLICVKQETSENAEFGIKEENEALPAKRQRKPTSHYVPEDRHRSQRLADNAEGAVPGAWPGRPRVPDTRLPEAAVLEPVRAPAVKRVIKVEAEAGGDGRASGSERAGGRAPSKRARVTVDETAALGPAAPQLPKRTFPNNAGVYGKYEPGTQVFTEDGQLFREWPIVHLHMYTNKLKLYDANHSQITKSCHFCQYQHVLHECQNHKAGKGDGAPDVCHRSYCERCLKKHFPNCKLPDGTWDVIHACPRCRGICTCRACMRSEHGTGIRPPQWTQDQHTQFRRFVLRRTAPVVKAVLEAEDREVAREGRQLEQVAPVKLRKERFMCNVCATSIANLHRHCQACDWDVCVTCCSKLWEPNHGVCRPVQVPPPDPPPEPAPSPPGDEPLAPPAPPAPLTQMMPLRCLQQGCANPSCSAARGTLQRLTSTNDLAALRALSQDPEYADASPEPLPADIWQGREAVADSFSQGPEAGSSATTGSAAQTIQIWGHTLPRSHVRLARAAAPSSPSSPDTPPECSSHIFTPHADDLKPSSPRFLEYMALFHQRWLRGEPVIVRGIRGRMAWDSETMLRAVRELGSKRFNTDRDMDIEVLDCTSSWGVISMSQAQFFHGYRRYMNEQMLKVKDWPPQAHFKERLPRHHQDYLEVVLPVPEYTHPAAGPLNMASMLPPDALPTDLGPKTYIAYGRIKEHEEEGDSVTKLHVDMADAVNVMVDCHIDQFEKKHQHVRCGDELWDFQKYGLAGAVWNIVRREDVGSLSSYLQEHSSAFIHHGLPVPQHQGQDPILDQMYMLTEQHWRQLEAQHGVRAWHFEQHMGEAVFIPAGCPHQVRNLRSCIKVAVDFVSPESSHEVVLMAERLAQAHLRSNLSVDESHYSEKLQGLLMILSAAARCYRALHLQLSPTSHLQQAQSRQRK